MQISVDLDRILDALDDMERDLLEADAMAQGISVEAAAIEMIREGLRAENIDGLFHLVDSQWKSH